LRRDSPVGLLHQPFTVDELKRLDLKELELLKTAITNSIRTDAEIRVLLQRKVRHVYTRLQQVTSSEEPR
jgi:hypothetical protein